MKWKLLGMSLALSAVMIAAVVLGSPYAPVVEPVRDIEEIWAIEDTRTESDGPLVTALENNGVPLAYDAAENVFYCTLGMNNGEEWPQIHLTAPGAKHVNLVFVDDYSYDSCSDALYAGYPYQIMAYTDTAYAYMDVIFTGLPLVQMEAGEELSDQDSLVEVKISAYGAEPVSSQALVHYRGAVSLRMDKKSYKIDFVRDARGRDNQVDLPGFGLRKDIILGSMVTDWLLLRDVLTWKVYDKMLDNRADSPFSARKIEYAELFVNDEYRGVYMMMEPMNLREEIAKTGEQHLLTDSVYRSRFMWFSKDEWQVMTNPRKEDSYFEARYAPSAELPFAGLEHYCELLTCEDDETFIRLAEKHIDIESLVRYVLLLQAGALTDNVNNNMYIWAHQSPDGLRYTFAPWDLDMTWGRNEHKLGEMYENWLAFPLADRILALNAGDAARKLAQQWKAWRKDIFTLETVEEILAHYSAELSDSGAAVRNAARWDLSVDDSGGAHILYAAQLRFETVDRAVEQIEQMLSGGNIPAFLLASGYEYMSTPVYQVY